MPDLIIFVSPVHDNEKQFFLLSKSPLVISYNTLPFVPWSASFAPTTRMVDPDAMSSLTSVDLGNGKNTGMLSFTSVKVTTTC